MLRCPFVVSGHPSYPTNGHLNMVTVSYQGGPSDGFNLFTALQAWLSPHEAVVPESELFGTDLTQQQVTRQDTQQMVSSQQLAQAAALCQLRIPYTVVDTVAQVGVVDHGLQPVEQRAHVVRVGIDHPDEPWWLRRLGDVGQVPRGTYGVGQGGRVIVSV